MLTTHLPLWTWPAGMITFLSMRAWLCLLLIAVFALVSAGLEGNRAEADVRVHAAASFERPASGMADCEHCNAEEVTSTAMPCGSVCAPSAVAVSTEQTYQLASAPAPRFPPVGDSLAGASPAPEPSPPRPYSS